MANSYNELFGLGTHSEDAALEGWWKLQETTGSSATDSSSNARNGTIVGMGSNPVTATGPTGWLSSAFNFDQIDDWISIPQVSVAHGAQTWIWYSKGSSSSQQWVFGSDQNNVTGVHYNNPLDTIKMRSNNGSFLEFATNKHRDGEWHFIAITSDGISGAMYIDADAAIPPSVSGDNFAATINTIGRRSSGAYQDGERANYLLFSRELSQLEVAEVRLGPEPIFTVNPILSGTATVGEVLSSTTGTAEIDQTEFPGLSNGTVNYSYQWTRSDDNTGTGEADIAGATSSSYTLVSGDIGKFIRCRVRASNDGGFDSAADTNTAFSAEVANVSSGPTDLAADPITAGVPVLDAASLTSTTSLAADPVTAGTPTLDATSLTSTTSLSADPVVSGTPVVDASSLTATTSLVADGVLAGIPVLDAANLSTDISIDSLTVTSPSSLAIRITGTTNGNRVQYVIETAPGSEPAVDATPTGFEDVTPNSPFQIDITGLSAGNKRVWARAVRTGS